MFRRRRCRVWPERERSRFPVRARPQFSRPNAKKGVRSNSTVLPFLRPHYFLQHEWLLFLPLAQAPSLHLPMPHLPSLQQAAHCAAVAQHDVAPLPQQLDVAALAMPAEAVAKASATKRCLIDFII